MLSQPVYSYLGEITSSVKILAQFYHSFLQLLGNALFPLQDSHDSQSAEFQVSHRMNPQLISPRTPPFPLSLSRKMGQVLVELLMGHRLLDYALFASQPQALILELCASPWLEVLNLPPANASGVSSEFERKVQGGEDGSTYVMIDPASGEGAQPSWLAGRWSGCSCGLHQHRTASLHRSQERMVFSSAAWFRTH